ncbi:bifunctional phosphopantothenoylcysteine decarboxylase/phosphopantothenate--cysteine ligase CoaBC [Clostridium cellulovorans]|uniref:Coenzyme A biosynthesis bifunctional protein CoaBC n=1 Tax=Clostridium cellulovorans (strain ATCC 35296 / DSM 3052 / OCM 3 / 743B) TaxID=573061 RepID=D9SL99_CLOC7|nr:phosphopantothenoylcysteine decarboxylase/phosphopantothenate/cysteine ligase [Clostridium cellulovorans 743B]
MKKKTIVLGVSGGIAVYKALDVVSKLKKKDYDVHVIMTKNAMEFVTPLSFQSISQNMVITDMFAEPKAWEIQHISLAKKADLMVIVPATANIIGKVANGIADDMLSTTIMATKAPVIFAPAMNTNMYQNPIVQENMSKLKGYGYEFIDTVKGRLACGDVGEGKLADTEDIVQYIESKLYDIKDLSGKKVMITAGPTIAPIDPVRYISNYSSGKMGYAIAEEARDRGAEVVLISGDVSIPDIKGVRIIKVKTNPDMKEAVLKEFDDAEIIIKTAAVTDFKIKNYSDIKIKKKDEGLTLELEKDTDILKTLGSMKKNQILVGFAAESNDVIENAKAKLDKKNLDFVVANDISVSDSGFNSDDNKVTIISRNGEELHLEKMNKRAVAKEIFNKILKKR